MGSFILSRVVPIGDEWMLSGSRRVSAGRSRRGLSLRRALIALRSARQVFRNPEKLELGRELQRQEHKRFVDFFGADSSWLPGQRD